MPPLDPIALIHASVAAWPLQFRQAASEADQLRLPKKPNRIVFCGMGGSGIGARVLAGVVRLELKIPFEIIADYSLPPLDRKSVVIAASYSGNTEETIACVYTAYQKKYPLIVMGVGGELAAWTKLRKIPTIRFDSRHNPSNQPRLGFGYTIGALATLLTRWQLIKNIPTPSSRSARGGEAISGLLRRTAPRNDIIKKTVLIFGADHLADVARLGAYYFNETAKQFAFTLPLPEANHHILEARLPKGSLVALFLEAPDKNPANKKRLTRTRQVLNLPSFVLTTHKGSRFAQAWDMASQLGHLSAELARLNHVDPTALPNVEGFKLSLRGTK